MTRFALIALLLAPFSAHAEGVWTTMSGEEITVALTDKKLRYKDASQVFSASGKTLYTQGGRESWGNGELKITNIVANGRPKDTWRVIIWIDLEIRYALSARAMILPSARTSSR